MKPVPGGAGSLVSGVGGARWAIEDIVTYYNEQRIHSALDYQMPSEVAAAFITRAAAQKTVLLQGAHYGIGPCGVWRDVQGAVFWVVGCCLVGVGEGDWVGLGRG